MNEILKMFRECGEIISGEMLTKDVEPKILFDAGGKVIATRDGADVSNLQEEDLIVMKMKRLPIVGTGIRAMVYSQTYYCKKCLEEAIPFRASLDDMAQIIGNAVYIADGRKADRAAGKSLKKALKHSNGCMVFRGANSKGKGVGYNITVGRSLKEAATALTVMEKAAAAEWKAGKLGGSVPLEKNDVKAMQRNYLKNYSQQTRQEESIPLDNFPQEEQELRKQLVHYGNRLADEKLVQGTWGNLSIRLNDDEMLVTPSGIPYDQLTPEDMVKVNFRTLAHTGKNRPTSEKELHAEIYQAREDVGAVVHAHSDYASVFACACKSMPVPSKEKEMRKRFGALIPVAAYAVPGTHQLAANTCAALGEGRAAIMAHHGMVVCGTDMEDAFKAALQFEELGKVSWYEYDKYDDEEEE